MIQLEVTVGSPDDTIGSFEGFGCCADSDLSLSFQFDRIAPFSTYLPFFLPIALFSKFSFTIILWICFFLIKIDSFL